MMVISYSERSSIRGQLIKAKNEYLENAPSLNETPHSVLPLLFSFTFAFE